MKTGTNPREWSANLAIRVDFFNVMMKILAFRACVQQSLVNGSGDMEILINTAMMKGYL